MSNATTKSSDTTVVKKLYYDDGEKISSILTKAELDEHNKDEKAHKNLFNKYTINTPIGLFEAFHNIGKNFCPKIGSNRNETTEAYAAAGFFISTYDTLNVIENQPSQFGQLVNIPSTIGETGDPRVSQLWFDGYNGYIFTRTGSKLNPIGGIKFNKLLLNSDNNITHSGVEFPDSELCDIGDIFYKTDDEVAYLLYSIKPEVKWIPIIDLKLPMGTSVRLKYPWLTLESYMVDDSVHKLEKNTDLNSLTNAGVYSCTGSSYASTIKNSPYTTGNFRLIVHLNRESWGMQILYAGNNNRIYTRGFISKDNTTVFTNWDSLIHKNDEVTKAIRASLDSDGNRFQDTYMKYVTDDASQTINSKLVLQDKQVTDIDQDIDVITLKASHPDKYNKTISFVNTNGEIISSVKATYETMTPENRKSIELLDKISGCSVGVANESNKGHVYINGRCKINDDVEIKSGHSITADKFIGKSTVTETLSANVITNDPTNLVIAHGKSSDLFRIVTMQQSDNPDFRYVGFETADGADSEIRFTQREIGDKNKGMFGKEINTVVLLDKDGNTKFPGIVIAKNIVAPKKNDYAEFFEKGEETEPGDIIVLDTESDDERYIKSTNKNNIVVGVHSGEFSHIIGGDSDNIEENMKKYIPVALAGRVYVKVVGPTKKGNVVVPSNIPGVGICSYIDRVPTNMVGICLEDSNDKGVKKIRVLIKK